MPSLQSINQNLEISGTNVESLSLDELSYVGNEFSLIDNNDLDQLNVNQLVNIQGPLTVTGSPLLKDLKGLGKLAFIGGDFSFIGDFVRLVATGALSSVHIC